MSNDDINLAGKTLLKAAFEHYERAPEAPACGGLGLDRKGRWLSRGEMFRKGAGVARSLHEAGIRRGEPVVLLIPQAIELQCAWVGALLLGSVPSVFAPPSPKIPAMIYAKMVAALLEVGGAKAIIAPRAQLADLRAQDLVKAGVRLLELEEVLKNEADPTLIDLSQYDPVLLQHSSGTTGMRKSIFLTHRQLMTQLQRYSRALDLTPTDRIASWLPLYHDMGLIAAWLLPLASGLPILTMSALEWIADPALLLEGIHDFRATLCWQPNFAYDVIAERISEEDAARWNLSCVRGFISCAEPIQYESGRRMLERLAPAGLRPEALAGSYAMAENVFAVTQSQIGRGFCIDAINGPALEKDGMARPAGPGDKQKKILVSSGRALGGAELKICDGSGAALADRAVGEIQIRTDCLFSGYHGAQDLTEAAFAGAWYRTGDLGYTVEGELFVTGRKSDMIIVMGKNIYPQDIEGIVDSLPGVVAGRTVAFGRFEAERGTEEIVVIAESELSDGDALRALRLRIAAAVSQLLDLAVGDVLIAPRGWLLKSSSGKLSRRANKGKYLEQTAKPGGVP